MFEVEQYVIYRNGPKVELGKIKSLKEDFAFVYYHSGETAAATRYEDIFPIVNAHVIEKTTLGGGQ